MRFFGRGRKKEQTSASVGAIYEVHAAVFQAAALSADAFSTISEKQWNAKLEPNILFGVHCEFYYFYAHIMDWLAWSWARRDAT